MIAETIKIFFSLAPAPLDQSLFEELRKHLATLKLQGLIEMWYDSSISAGSNDRDIIQSYMHRANIIVLLISADFFDSQQCVEVEMQYALAQHVVRATQVIPVLLRPTLWQGLSLEQYSPLPANGKPVSIWDNLDSALVEVAKGIHRVVKEIADRLTGARRPVKPPQFPLYTLPYRRNPFFTNREDILTALHRFFTSEQTPQAPQTRTQALYGLGGIGKTLLAVEYVYLHQHEYQAVLWLNAASHELLSSNILSLADQLGISLPGDADEQQRFAAIHQWLRHHDRWLLVLDNLDDFSMLDQLIPLYSGGHVLLITHSQATGPFASAVSVAQMSVEEGALLLLRRAKLIPKQGLRDAASESDLLQAMAIAQEVEGYPLALDQAGAYIEETQRSPAAYLKLYRQRQAALLSRRGRLADDHPDPVTTTLAVTFKKIAQVDPHALELLRLFAFLHPEALPDEMIVHGASALTGALHTLASDPLVLDEAIATLRRFSLVQHHADSTTLNMQRIVQIVIKKELTNRQQQQLASQAVRLVNAIFPDVLFANWEACERYAPQAQHCAALIRDFQLTLKEGGLLLERLGAYYSRRGCYAEAETYL
nr:TIR domain-containing protein [Ktedonobacteraceae bacterium]